MKISTYEFGENTDIQSIILLKAWLGKNPHLSSFMQLLTRFKSLLGGWTEHLSFSLAIGYRLPSILCHVGLSLERSQHDSHFIKTSKQELPIRRNASKVGVTVSFHLFDFRKTFNRAVVLWSREQALEFTLPFPPM